ncbi:MAG: urease accessory protein UreE [Paludibacteraceae bacterium]|nr:urease accessory protein UreE [Prevotellaceae bacterium]
MEILTKTLGNIYFDSEWKEKMVGIDVEYLLLDQWTAQKSRFLLKSDKGKEYALSLDRHAQLNNGDVIYFSPEEKRALVIKLDLSQVLVVNMEKWKGRPEQEILRMGVELGHAIGNQHWPAVMKEYKLYVPLTVDRKVMLSVMHTHAFEDVTYDFHPGEEVIPYLAPHEIRRLFGGTGPDSETHHHPVEKDAHEYSC